MPDYMPNAYYDAIAENYDESYLRDDADLQDDLAMIGDEIEQLFIGADLLDIASGTGFWSMAAAKGAKRVIGLERSAKMRELANGRDLPANLRFVEGDAWALDALEGEFNGAMALFWFSHIPKARMDEYLGMLAKRLGPGGMVLLADSLAEPYKTPLKDIPESAGDTFAARDLGDAGNFEVLKNCYSGGEVAGLLESSEHVEYLRVREGSYFWLATYLVPGDNDFDDDEMDDADWEG